MKAAIVIFAIGFCISASGAGIPPIATLESGKIPAAVTQGIGQVLCQFTKPNGISLNPNHPINNSCWYGFVAAGDTGVYSVKAWNETTQVQAFGSDMVPGPECSGSGRPICIIPFTEVASPVAPEK